MKRNERNGKKKKKPKKGNGKVKVNKW